MPGEAVTKTLSDAELREALDAAYARNLPRLEAQMREAMRAVLAPPMPMPDPEGAP